MKKIVLLLCGLVLLFPVHSTSGDYVIEEKSPDQDIIVYFFEDQYCSVCRSQKRFMESVVGNYPNIKVLTYNITDREKLNEIGELHGVKEPEMMAPTTFIGENYFQFMQFTSEEESKLLRAFEGEVVDDSCCVITIPILNIKVNTKDWSLLLMAALIGSLDGFNVCSLGALILILSIVISFNSRKKIFFYGGLFILTSVVVYGVLVFAWRGLHEMFAQYTNALGIFIGLAALFGGIYFFKEFWRFLRYGPSCNSAENKIAQRATAKLQKAFQDSKKTGVALAGSIVLFAVVITFVELPCSIGFPIIFTGMLAQAGVPLLTSVFYIIGYLFFYMLIEMIIFVGAVFTKDLWMVQGRAVTWITLFAALVMFYLSYYYLIG